MKTINGLRKCQRCNEVKFKWMLPLSNCPNCEYQDDHSSVLTIKDCLRGLTTIYSNNFALAAGEFL